MNETAQLPDTNLLESLLRQRHDLDQEIRRVRGSGPRADRPWWACKRCGYNWQGYWRNKPPKGCARCHSQSWMDEPLRPDARRIGDPPNPNWPARKRASKTRPQPSRFADRMALDIPVHIPVGLTPPPGHHLAANAAMDALRPRSRIAAEMNRVLERPAPQPETVASHIMEVSKEVMPLDAGESNSGTESPNHVGAGAPRAAEVNEGDSMPEPDPDLVMEADMREEES